jgi:SAM-dependent methyltransferase
MSSVDKPFGSSARAYDLLYEAAGKDYAAEADELYALIQQRHPGAHSLLDVACGTGAHLAHIQGRYEVTGLDLSPEMLAEAALRLPAVELVEADMRSFDLGRTFDAVLCLFSSIGYMDSDEELDEAIATMARHLGPGGVLVLDGWIRPQAWKEPGSTQALAHRRDELATARVVRSWREGRRSVLELHHLVGTSSGVEYTVETHVLTLFSEEAYRQAFEQAGLTVEVLPSPHPDRDRYVGLRAP